MATNRKSIGNIISAFYNNPIKIITAFVTLIAIVLGVIYTFGQILDTPSFQPEISKNNIEIVMDKSLAMADLVDGETKWSLAQKGLKDVFQFNTAKKDRVALRIFGGECRSEDNTQLLVEFGTNNDNTIIDALKEVKLSGSTTLISAIIEASGDFNNLYKVDGVVKKQLIVITAGGKLCLDNAAEVITRRLSRLGGDITVDFHLVAVGVSQDLIKELIVVAKSAGGVIHFVGNNSEFKDALNGIINHHFYPNPTIDYADNSQRAVEESLALSAPQVNGGASMVDDTTSVVDASCSDMESDYELNGEGEQLSHFVFSAPPLEDLESGEKIYGPLVKLLSKILHAKVVYEHPDGWARYTRDMRNGKYDIVFGGSHFAAWRIKNISHLPVVKLPGNLTFVILANRSTKHVNTERDLVGIDICALASPNLGTVMLYNMFTNPNVPQIYDVTGDFKAVYHALKGGKCEAAVVRDNLYYALKKEEKRKVKIIVETKPMPNQTITVSRRLAKKVKIISKCLTSAEGARSSQKLLSRFSKNKKIFTSAKVREYRNIDNLLTGVVWGW